MRTNRKKSRKGSYMARKQNRLGYFFMSPWILGFVVFTLIPFIMTIILSFCSVSSTIKGYELSFIGSSAIRNSCLRCFPSWAW